MKMCIAFKGKKSGVKSQNAFENWQLMLSDRGQKKTKLVLLSQVSIGVVVRRIPIRMTLNPELCKLAPCIGASHISL